MSVIDQFLQASDEQKVGILSGENNIELMVSAMIEGFEGEDETEKILHLVVLEENAEYLLAKQGRMEQVCTHLNGILDKPESSPRLCCQVVSTLTTILILLDIKTKQPRALESFIDLLFDIISNINVSDDRIFRGMACQCLCELERTYPGLLIGGLGHFFSFAQKENTHISMCYTNLFRLVLQHRLESLCNYESDPLLNPKKPGDNILYASSSGSSGGFFSLFSIKQSLSPFQVPSGVEPLARVPIPYVNGFEMPCNLVPSDSQLFKLFSKDIKRGLHLIAESAEKYYTKWGQFESLQQLISLLLVCPDLTSDIFHFCFSTFGLGYSVLQTHMLVFLLTTFMVDGPLTHVAEGLLQRGMKQASDSTHSWEFRVLNFEWMNSLSYLLSPNVSLIEHYRIEWFFPSIFDPFILRQAKLQALAQRIANNQFTKGDQAVLSSPFFMKSLKSISGFRSCSSSSAHAVAGFRVLLSFLQSPTLFEPTTNYINKLLQKEPHFAANTCSVIQTLRGKNGELKHRFSVLLLEWFVTHASPSHIERHKHYLSSYLQLMNLIVEDQFINPQGLISVLHKLFRMTNLCQIGDWHLGNLLLSVFKKILTKHNTAQFFQQFTELLSFIEVYFNNVDISDHAHLYNAMLTHLPKDRMDLILLSSMALQQAKETQMEGSSTIGGIENVGFDILVMHRLNQYYNSLAAASIQVVESDINPPEGLAMDGILDEYLHFVSMEAHRSVSTKKQKDQTPQQADPYDELAVCHEGLTSVTLPFYVTFNPSVSRPIPPKLNELLAVTVNIVVVPLIPVPATFSVVLSFNDSSGTVLSGSMEALRIRFWDLFVPVPLPSAWSQYRQWYLSALFQKMWSSLSSNQRNTNLLNHTSKSSCSLKYISVPKSILLKNLHAKMSPFIVHHPKGIDPEADEKSDSSSLDSQEEICLFIFLPQHYHLLMKLKIGSNQTTVTIETDYWRVLTFVDGFFEDLLTEKTH